MVVQHNLRAMNSNRMLGLTANVQSKSTEKLSSGYKINRAADDAAGLSISEKMRKQIRGLSQASLNAQDGISAVQTAEGALNEVQDMLQRMNELAVKASNGTMSEDDRSYIQNEIDQLVDEIDRVSETTKFNETYLLKGAGTETTTEASEVGLSGYSKSTGVTTDALVREVSGNKYTGTIASTLGANTKESVKISYKDADGFARDVTVEFMAGKNDKETAANLAEAINADEKFSALFTASVDGNELAIESKANKYDLDEAGVAGASTITAIEFASSDENNEAALKTTIAKADGTVGAPGVVGFDEVLAAGTSYVLDISSMQTGDTIEIDGVTYTYDEDKVNGTNTLANTFNSVDDLEALLGDDYSVALEYSGKQNVTYSANDQNAGSVNVVNKDVTGTFATTTTKISTLLDGTATTGIGNVAFDPQDAGLTATNTSAAVDGTPQVTYTAGKLALVITKNEKPEEAVEATTTTDALHFSFQVGADTTEENKISVDIESMSAKSLGVDGLRVDGKDSKNADAAVDVIGEAIQRVSTQRSALGAVQNRLEHTIANLDNVVENTTAAESQIRDTDMATEMVKYSNNNILAQAGQAMLAQANQANQGVLSLLG